MATKMHDTHDDGGIAVTELPQGFRLGAAACGFRRPDRLDLALVVADVPAVAAGVFTTNRFQAAPVCIAREHVAANPQGIRAILVNSGQANACTGEEGMRRCRATLDLLSSAGIAPHEVLPASTGVIGEQLPLERWPAGVAMALERLGQVPLVDAARAIMTTDTFPKVAAAQITVQGRTIRLAGMAKGAGMICPQMATMLGFILCDAQVEPAWWQAALRRAVDASFNAITVDGDTSTNDCVLALASGVGGVVPEHALPELEAALLDVCQELAFQIVQDAEGGTKVLRIRVSGAADPADAQRVARAVGNSPLVKTALYGRDPNWGRIVAAVGRSGAQFEAHRVRVDLAGHTVFAAGLPLPADWDGLLASALRRDEVTIDIHLGAGEAGCELLASDLTEEYIRINARYRT
jgi:glutamate N-acetyltransferase/amino-acid N-acetyltransferase